MRIDRRARIAVLPGLLLAASACQPGHGGSLEPASGQQTGEDGPTGGGSVSLVSNGLAIQVSGRWYTNDPSNRFALDVIYRNLSDRAVVLDGGGLGAIRGGDTGLLSSLIDMTGVDLADDRTDNDEPRTIIDESQVRKRGTIRIAPGERRTYLATAYLSDEAVALGDGQRVTVTVPTVRGGGEAIFEVDDGWF